MCGRYDLVVIGQALAARFGVAPEQAGEVAQGWQPRYNIAPSQSVSVVRLDADMTWHDSAMFRFRQWAKRQVRTGYGGLDFATRFGAGGDNPFRRQIRSARFWISERPDSVMTGISASPIARAA